MNNKIRLFGLYTIIVLLLSTSCTNTSPGSIGSTLPPAATTYPSDLKLWNEASSAQCSVHINHMDANDENNNAALYMPEHIEISGGYVGPYIIKKYNDTTLWMAIGIYERKIPLYPEEIQELNDLYRSITDFSSPYNEAGYVDTVLYHNGHCHTFDHFDTTQPELKRYIDLLQDYYDGHVHEPPVYDEDGNYTENVYQGTVKLPDKIVVHDYYDGATLTIEKTWNESNPVFHMWFCDSAQNYENITLMKDEANELNRLYESTTDFSGEITGDGPLVEIHHGDTVERFTLGHATQEEWNRYLELVLKQWYAPR